MKTKIMELVQFMALLRDVLATRGLVFGLHLQCAAVPISARRRPIMLLAVAMLPASFLQASAADRVWIDATDNWDVPTSWSGGVVPTFADSDTASVDNGGTVFVPAGASASAYSVRFGNSGTGTLNIDGGAVSDQTGILGYSPGSNGSATIASGTWSNTSALIVGASGTGTLNIDGGTVSNWWASIGSEAGSNGSATVTDGVWSNGGFLFVAMYGAGVLNLNGGLVAVNSGNGTVSLACSAGSTGTLNLGNGGSAGTLNAGLVNGGQGVATVNFNHTGDSTFAPQLTGSLSVNKLGTGTTTLTGSNNYTGETNVSAGELVFAMSEKLGALNIATSGTAVLQAHIGGPSNAKVLDLSALTISAMTPLVGDGGKELVGLASPDPVPEPGTVGLLTVAAIGGVLLSFSGRKSAS